MNLMKHIISIMCILLIICAGSVLTEAMTSTNYMIIFDSINTGGRLSTSTNYNLEDTTGEIASGYGTSTNYTLSAGFQQFSDTYISISTEADVNIGSLNGLGGEGGATSTWLVTTNNTAGYQLTIVSSTTPALKSGPYSFADYVSGGPDPDYSFTTPATSSVFGFTPEGVDIVLRFKDNGSVCNAGGGDTVSTCWAGFSTTSTLVSQKNSSNHPTGSTTTIRYRAGIGDSAIQPPGDYASYITVTALTL